MDSFDYVIIGAGSAGCVLASRLTEDGQSSACILEYGGSDRSIWIQMPAALSIPMNMPRFNWGYASEPEPHLNNRRLNCPRGKVLGGSSSINGLVYVRGHALDFERWANEDGAAGWGWAQVLPYFRRAESRLEGGDAYRGDQGPLATRRGPMRNPLFKAFIEAGRQAGYPVSEDVNGAQQEGFGAMDMTVRNGVRWSTSNAYLRPALNRPNLHLRTHRRVARILFENRRAIGVEVLVGDGDSPEREVIRARREVILAAGSINSPQILKLSGIGPAPELQALGLPVVADRRGVGENLQDHLEFYFQIACTQPITLYRNAGFFGRMLVGAQWLFTRTGLGASNQFESCGFIRSRPGIRHPDIQYHFLPLAVTYDGQSLAKEHGFQAHVGPMRSKSRGWVRLASPDPRAAPKIFFNYMSHPDDWVEMRACVRLTREIFAQPAFAPFRGREIQPGAAVQSDEAIDAFIAEHVESALHPSCTCRMGDPRDPMAVVDPEGRVIGVEGLRVADSSTMPSITTGNLNAPTIMMAEKFSDHILGRPLLPPANQGWREVEGWQHSQRSSAVVEAG